MNDVNHLEGKSSNNHQIARFMFVMALVAIVCLELYQTQQLLEIDKKILVAQAVRLTGQPIDPETITNVRSIEKEQPKPVNPFVSNAADNQEKTSPVRPSVEAANRAKQLYDEGKLQDKSTSESMQSEQAQSSSRSQDINKRTQPANTP